MDTQQIFDKVVNHLLTQGKKSVSPLNPKKCLYRGPDGSSCAVGCLITDKYYNSIFENKTALSLYVIKAVERSLGQPLSVEQKKLLQELQHIHDDEDAWSWPYILSDVAKSWKLKINFPVPAT